MEEQTGYRSTDTDKPRSSDEQEKAKALVSSNPAFEELAALGLESELPAIVGTADASITSQPGKTRDAGLSPFTKWLITLGTPEEHPFVTQEVSKEEESPAGIETAIGTGSDVDTGEDVEVEAQPGTEKDEKGDKPVDTPKASKSKKSQKKKSRMF